MTPRLVALVSREVVLILHGVRLLLERTTAWRLQECWPYAMEQEPLVGQRMLLHVQGYPSLALVRQRWLASEAHPRVVVDKVEDVSGRISRP